MKGTYRQLMSVEDLLQALFQDRAFFEEHGITHVRSVSLYFTPCDESGKAVKIRDQKGRTVEGYETAGCYHSAADSYGEEGRLEPRTVRSTTTGGKGKGGGGGAGKGDSRRCKPG